MFDQKSTQYFPEVKAFERTKSMSICGVISIPAIFPFSNTYPRINSTSGACPSL
jgi:hypothetical protein